MIRPLKWCAVEMMSQAGMLRMLNVAYCAATEMVNWPAELVSSKNDEYRDGKTAGMVRPLK
jgi:hypothetical protein